MLAFAAIAVAWIVGTDLAVDRFAADDPVLASRLQTVKGVAFVLGCSVIFGLLRSRESARRKAAESSDAAARTHEARLQAILESSLAGLFWWEADGRISDANDAFLRLVGYDRAELAAGNLRWTTLTPPEWMEQDRVLLGVIRERGTLPPFQKEFFRRDGGRVSVLVGAATLGPGTDRGAAFVLDLTALRETQAALRRAESRAERAQRMEAVGRLAGGIAHDFNNMLTVILGHCEIVMRRLPPDHPDRESLTQIERAGKRASALTQKLLAFSRRQVLDPVVMDVNALLQETREMVERVVGEDVRVEWRLAPELAPVKADRSQLEQVWLNLVLNARDAMPRGGTLTVSTSEVTLGAADSSWSGELRPGRYVAVAFADTGSGMTEDVRKRIFEPFFTTKEPGRGTGLGLATVEGTIRQSGGMVTFETELGRGTTFRVLLPAATGAVPRTSDAAAPESPAARGESVLVAEDAPELRTLFARILEARGYHVIEAKDAESALRAAEEHDGTLHALVTDLVMPGLDGRALAARLRATRQGLGVVYVSGHDDRQIETRGLRPEDGPLLRKPFSAHDLARLVHESIVAGRARAGAVRQSPG